MLIAKKVRLLPTPEQESLFWQSAGTARWAYNYGLGRIQDTYDETGQWLMVGDVKKEITVMKYTEEYEWLQNVSANVPKQALRNLQKALKRKKDGVSEFPTFNKKLGSNISFYVNYESLNGANLTFSVYNNINIIIIKNYYHFISPIFIGSSYKKMTLIE